MISEFLSNIGALFRVRFLIHEMSPAMVIYGFDPYY
jgi:hypothetical protein